MKKRLIPVLLLITALLLTAIAPAETVSSETICIGCGAAEDHLCPSCGDYSCRPGYHMQKHGAACIECGEAFCGPYRAKGHVDCPCGVFSCAEDYDPAAHEACYCGAYACQEKYFAVNHAECPGCGLRICGRAYTLTSHEACSGCGMRKCDPYYIEAEHRKCNGCRALYCASEADHTFCMACNRYVCNFMHEYEKFEHKANWKGEYDCLGYPAEPEPLLPPDDGCPGGCGAATPCEQYVCADLKNGECAVNTPTYKCQLKKQGTLHYCTHCTSYVCIKHLEQNTSHTPTTPLS